MMAGRKNTFAPDEKSMPIGNQNDPFYEEKRNHVSGPEDQVFWPCLKGSRIKQTVCNKKFMKTKEIHCHSKGLMKWLILCFMLFFTNMALAQFDKPGNVPVLWPTGGFGVDGDGYTNIWNPPFTHNNIGDWYDSIPVPYPGSGEPVFDGTGAVISPPSADIAVIAHFTDGFKNDGLGGDLSVFDQSNKISDNPNTYLVKPGSVPPKDDMQHATGIFTWGNPALGPITGPNIGFDTIGDTNDLWCVFACDRWKVNGSSYVDFEFNQDSIVLNTTTGVMTSYAPATDADGDPTGGRNPGDFLITIEFTQGGAVGNVWVDKWLKDGLHTAYSWHTQDISTAAYAKTIYMVFNKVITNVPWKIYDQESIPGSDPPLYQYAINQFAEGAINLGKLMLGAQGPCKTVATIWARTKSSHSPTAELKDLAGIATLDIPVPTPEVTCAQPVELQACTTLAEIETAWDNWRTGFSASGGTPPVDTTYDRAVPETVPANLECGGVFTLKFKAVDLCGKADSCTSTFTVGTPDPVVIDNAENLTTDACDYANQAAADLAFANWLATADVSGGCDPTSTPDITTAPPYCGGEVTVTWTIADHCYAGSTYAATFTITAPDPVVIDYAEDMTVPACTYANQAEADLAFANWLATAGVSGGCDPTSTPDITTGPPYCGGAVTVTWTIADHCYAGSTYAATFTIEAPNPIVVYCPDTVLLPACTPAENIIAAYDAWKASFMKSGDCILSDNMADFPPLVINADYSVNLSFTYIVTGLCDNTPHQCSSSFTVPPCAPNCETAYGTLGNANAYCFYNYGFNNWGWSNKITADGIYTLPLYQGNPSCTPNPANLVGVVTATMAAGTLTVHYQTDPGFSMNEVHTYAGCLMFPLGNNGKPTVAPGQYTFNASSLDYISELTVTFTGVTFPCYLIAHAKACDMQGAGSETFGPVGFECNPPKGHGKTDAMVNMTVRPNPFFTSTNIDFSLSYDGNATVEVFNTLGMKMVTLFSGDVSANEVKTVRFTPPDGTGEGVFFCIIRTERETVVQRLILVK